MAFKILSWNINSIRIRTKNLLEIIEEHDPDIICLQELKCETEHFPYAELEHLPYNFFVHGSKSYNGVAIFSKLKADSVRTEFPGNPCPEQTRFIEIALNTPLGYCRIICLYAPNGGEVGSDKFALKLAFYDAFTNYLAAIKSFDEKIIICSDYNVAPFDIDVYDPQKLYGTTCFSAVEQSKLRRILNSGFIDNFRLLHPKSPEFTWWDYRAGAFEQNKGYRIDSIISCAATTKFLQACEIIYSARAQEKPSDHAPVKAVYDCISHK